MHGFHRWMKYQEAQPLLYYCITLISLLSRLSRHLWFTEVCFDLGSYFSHPHSHGFSLTGHLAVSWVRRHAQPWGFCTGCSGYLQPPSHPSPRDLRGSPSYLLLCSMSASQAGQFWPLCFQWWPPFTMVHFTLFLVVFTTFVLCPLLWKIIVFIFNLSIVGVQYYISFMCTTWWFNTFTMWPRQ